MIDHNQRFPTILNVATTINFWLGRNGSDVHIDYRRTAVGQKAVSVSGAKLWNSIPMNIRNSNTFVTFKSHISQSEIYRRGNVENDWNSSVVRRSPSKAIIGFPMISDYFQCRKCRFPDVGYRRKCQGFCALKSSEFRLKHAVRNYFSMCLH